jgi:hypothetical protein
MATRLYFRDATNSLAGTFPAGEQSAAAVTGTSTATGANTLRTMRTTTGNAVASLAVTTTASTVAQNNFMGFFCSPPLKGDQTVGGGTMILNGAETESNASANWWINSLNIYVWRPSTGVRVGVIRDAAGTSLGGLEPTAINSQQVSHITGITSTAIAALSGDVVICEIWIRATQGAAMSYTGTFFYDGTTVNTTENAIVTSHASFIELSENLIFEGGERTFVVIV